MAVTPSTESSFYRQLMGQSGDFMVEKNKLPIVREFDINGFPAILTMTFSYTSERNESGYSMNCNVEDVCLRVFDGQSWTEIRTNPTIEEFLLKQINDGIFTTESIANELSRREGVQEIVIDPHKEFSIYKGDELWHKSDGPVRILVVYD